MKLAAEIEQDPQVQAAKIVALEQAVEQLVTIHRTNQQAFQRAFQMTDAHLWVLNRIVRDIVSDTVLKLDNGAVDMNSYYDLFNANQKLLAQQAEDEAEKKKAETVEAEAKAEANSGAEVFGGDTVNAGA